MGIDTSVAGGNQRIINALGHPTIAANILSVLQLHLTDGQALDASMYDLLVGSVPLLRRPGGTFDRGIAAPGLIGVAPVVVEGQKATYSATLVGYTPPATPTDFFTLTGSGTTTVRVTRLTIGGLTSAASSYLMNLYKRTVAPTGGTFVSLASSVVQHDSADAAASAVPGSYSALGTPGTGLIEDAQYLNTAGADLAGKLVWDFTTNSEKGLVLRGTSQQLALNGGGVALPGGMVLNINIRWTEESPLN